MDVLMTHVAGLDVHKKTVVACCRTRDDTGRLLCQTRTFGTMTPDLLALADWLTSLHITHVAMEGTGEFWKPVYNLLEAAFTVWVVHAQHIKRVPGRKTDVQDAAWIAELLEHGLLTPSFIPPPPQRDLRDLTRQRTNLQQERTQVVNHLHKTLEAANLKLTSVVSDVTGVSALAMLQAIVANDPQASQPAQLAALAQGRLRHKRELLEQALTGRVRAHHRFMIAQYLIHLDFLDEQLATFEGAITAALQATAVDEAAPSAHPPAGAAPADALAGSASSPAPVPARGHPLTWAAAAPLLDTIPGIGPRVASILLAEVGSDMTRFASAHQLTSWAKLCPRTHESAGKRSPMSIGAGNTWLRSGLIQAAHAAVKVKDCYFATLFRRLVGRLGVRRAIVAVARHLLIAVYHVLTTGQPYQEYVPPCDSRQRDRQANRLRYRLEQLGYTVSITPPEASA